MDQTKLGGVTGAQDASFAGRIRAQHTARQNADGIERARRPGFARDCGRDYEPERMATISFRNAASTRSPSGVLFTQLAITGSIRFFHFASSAGGSL